MKIQKHTASRLILVLLLLVGQWLIVAHAAQHDVDDRYHIACALCLAEAGVDTQLYSPSNQAIFRHTDTLKESVTPTRHTARYSFNLCIRGPPRS
jgi:hypothetical protein